jgi:protein-disulfide isomerase
MNSIRPFILTLSAILLLSGCVSDAGGTASASQSGRVRPTLGSSDATVVIQEFSDLECPACGLIGPVLKKAVERNSDWLRLEFFHFPLPQHREAFRAAEASECAFEQGKFWEYSEVLFKNQSALSPDELKQYALDLGLDPASFDACFDGRDKKKVVGTDLALGQDRHLTYTPSIFINGELTQWRFDTVEKLEAYLRWKRDNVTGGKSGVQSAE